MGGSMETASSATGGVRGALGRLRHAPLWVWITILLTFGLLIFAYLQYRKSAAGTSATSGGTSAAGYGTVPTAGTGQPMWDTANQGAFTTGNASDLAALLAYIQSQQTPNPSPTATPSPPPPPTPAPLRPLRPAPLPSAPQVPARTGTIGASSGYLPIRPIWRVA